MDRDSAVNEEEYERVLNALDRAEDLPAPLREGERERHQVTLPEPGALAI